MYGSEKAMATQSSTLAWKIPQTEEPDRLQSMGLLRVRHDWVTSLSLFTFMHWRRKWQPTPVFLPGESQRQWAPVYGVAQSRTWLKRLSSSSSSNICIIFYGRKKSSKEFLLLFYTAAAATAAKSLQSCPTLCDPIDASPLGSSVPGILQARILEWAAISFSNAWKWKVKVKSLSHAQLLATPWTAAHQAPSSMGFSRQEYWSGVPLPSPLFYTMISQLLTFQNWRLKQALL